MARVAPLRSPFALPAAAWLLTVLAGACGSAVTEDARPEEPVRNGEPVALAQPEVAAPKEVPLRFPRREEFFPVPAPQATPTPAKSPAVSGDQYEVCPDPLSRMHIDVELLKEDFRLDRLRRREARHVFGGPPDPDLEREFAHLVEKLEIAQGRAASEELRSALSKLRRDLDREHEEWRMHCDDPDSE